MSDERLARQCCDLLGWEWLTDPAPRASGDMPAVYAQGDGTYRASGPQRGRTRDWYTIDLPTLATAALVRHAGPVDVGRCSKCGGSQTRRRQSGHTVFLSACPACTVDGKHPGRRVVSAPEAVLLAAPMVEHDTVHGVSDHDVDEIQAEREREGWVVRRETQTAATSYILYRLHCHRSLPGHEGARVALLQLAEGWRELEESCPRQPECSAEFALAVWGDYLEAAGRTVPGLRAFAECPDVARWLLAWLAGECLTCKGSQWERVELPLGERPEPVSLGGDPESVEEWMGVPGSGSRDTQQWDRACRSCRDDRGVTGLAIGPHLPAIYAHLTAAWERETVECVRCKGVGQIGWRRPGHPYHTVTPCQRCAGLGRVRPDEHLEAAQ